MVNELGRDEEIMTFSNFRDPSNMFIERTVNSTVLTFRRVSAEDTLPLISTLSINSVSYDLNGVIVNCMDATNSISPMSVSTTIHIIDIST